MKRQKNQLSSIGLLGKAVATATILGCSTVPQAVHAATTPDVMTSGVYVSILSPTVNVNDPNKQVEVSAFYQAAPVTGGVTTLELYIDGQQEAVKKLDSPEDKGIVSFVISPGTLSAGAHHVVVTVSAGDAEVASAKTSISIAADTSDSAAAPTPSLGGDTADGSAPAVAITEPMPDSTVIGTIDIKVDAHDNTGKPPYVSLFIDHNFKTLRNFPPYDFAWDTTRVANGYHTLEVWGYNDNQTVGHTEPMSVYVNNPSGRTMVRHDLLDTLPASLVIKSATQAAAITPTAPKKHDVARAAAVLAQGSPLTSKQARLAIAANFDSGTPFSEETTLMSPFLPKHTPQLNQIAVAPPVKTAPILAAQSTVSVAAAPAVAVDDQPAASTQLSDYAPLTTPSTTDKVSMPAVVKSAPAPPVEAPEQVVIHTVTYDTPSDSSTVDSQPMIEAPVVTTRSIETAPAVTHKAAPTELSSLTTPAKSPYTMQLDDTKPFTTVVSSDHSSMEAPDVKLIPVHLPARLAAGKAVTGLRRETSMASASIDSATLFTPQTALAAPDVAAAKAEDVIQDHKVQAQIETLGQTANGFPASEVVRSHANEVVMNDRLVALDQPLQDKNSFLFAPFRQIFENEGGMVAWNSTLHQVHALSGSRDIELTIGSKTATVNQEPLTLNAVPYIEEGHTMIPLAFVPIALDATVSYDPNSGHIEINSKD